MGDTVIQGIRNLTIYLGELTVLPGEASVKDRLRQSASKVINSKPFTSGPKVDEPPGCAGIGEKKGNEEDGEKNQYSHAAATDRLAYFLEEEHWTKQAQPRNEGTDLARTSIYIISS